MLSLRLAFVFLTFIYVSAQLGCLQITNCTSCKSTNGCGYCDIPGGIGTCFPEVSETLCSTVGGRWNPDTCAPPIVSACLAATDCDSCLNRTGCGWCGLGDAGVGVCHDSNQTCNAMSGNFFIGQCPAGTHCGNYSTCQECEQDNNCTSCQITPTTFTCVAAQQRDLYCPTAFYKQGASCNVSAEALTCASRTTCEACSGDFNTSNTSQPNNATNNSTSNNPKCGWCNFGSTRGGECFRSQDSSFCNLGLWNEVCPAPNAPDNCTNVTDTDFCTGNLLSINQTDMPWVTKLYDTYFNQRWSDITDALHKEVNNYQIGFCETCWNAYKKFLCAAATPQCGMNSCYQNAKAGAADCIAACPCDSMDEFVVQPACYHCVQKCTAAAVGPSCRQLGLSKNSCRQLVRICGCSPKQQDVETICQDFDENGVDVDLGNDTCSTLPTWCSLSSGNQTSNFTDVTNINASSVSPQSNSSAIPPLNNSALQQPQAGRLCPNSRVCFSIYNSYGADVVANPITTLEGVNNNGDNGNGTHNQGAAVSNCASPLLLLAALFLLMFV